MRLLTAEQMAAVDRRAIEELGIPGTVLMENACVGLADAVGERFPDAAEVAIVCGPGNNGGDGLGLARHLDARGYRVHVFLVRGDDRPGGDAGLQLEILERAGRVVDEIVVTADDAEIEAGLRRVDSTLQSAVRRSDLVVDALFGTGLSRPLEGVYADVVRLLGESGRPILAVDLPSGLAGGDPEPIGPHLDADVTVTFAAPKVAQVLPPAADAVGELVVVDLAVPPELIDEAPGSWHLFTEAEAAELVAIQAAATPADAHKGTFGHVLVVGGSPGKSGAVVLAARASVRSGAGLVTAAVPESLLATVDAGSLESMTLALEADPDADPDTRIQALLDAAGERDAVALGPGLGTDAETVRLVRAIVGEIEAPLVLDADGLNALAEDRNDDLGQGLDRLAARGRADRATVLTPHPGEAARLLGRSVDEVQRDRPGAALELAERTGAVVVLKGFRTLVAEPDGTLFVNPTGSRALATGGTGDVLTGVIAALLARRHALDAAVAARLGVFVHGLAGDLAAREKGSIATAAGDVLESLSAAWRRLENPGLENPENPNR